MKSLQIFLKKTIGWQMFFSLFPSRYRECYALFASIILSFLKKLDHGESNPVMLMATTS